MSLAEVAGVGRHDAGFLDFVPGLFLVGIVAGFNQDDMQRGFKVVRVDVHGDLVARMELRIGDDGFSVFGEELGAGEHLETNDLAGRELKQQFFFVAVSERTLGRANGDLVASVASVGFGLMRRQVDVGERNSHAATGIAAAWIPAAGVRILGQSRKAQQSEDAEVAHRFL